MHVGIKLYDQLLCTLLDAACLLTRLCNTVDFMYGGKADLYFGVNTLLFMLYYYYWGRWSNMNAYNENDERKKSSIVEL